MVNITYHNYRYEDDFVNTDVNSDVYSHVNKSSNSVGGAMHGNHANISDSFSEFFLSYADEAIVESKLVLSKFNHCNKLIIFGVGGACIGSQALLAACAPGTIENRKVLFADSIISYDFSRIMREIDDSTMLLFISKSGNTTETIAQFLAVHKFCIANGINFVINSLVITFPSLRNDLCKIAHELSVRIFTHPNISGRFSCFTNVTILPALFAGVNVDAYVGAAKDLCIYKKSLIYNESNAYIKSLAQMIQSRVDQMIIMSYDSILVNLCNWYRQLWAESLGKFDRAPTPIIALGNADQHSQMQLYLAGPSNKFITFINNLNDDSESQVITDVEQVWKNELANAMRGKTIGGILKYNKYLTIDSIISSNIPCKIINIDSINEYHIGYLMSYFIIEILKIADIFDINPLNQMQVDNLKHNINKKLLENADVLHTSVMSG